MVTMLFLLLWLLGYKSDRTAGHTQLEQVLLRQGSQHLLASVGASGYFRPSDQEKNHEELLSV
jgi:hypothetical protein